MAMSSVDFVEDRNFGGIIFTRCRAERLVGDGESGKGENGQKVEDGFGNHG